MPPEVKKLILDNFQTFAALGMLMTWLILIQNGSAILKAFRRLILLAFSYFAYLLFKSGAPKFIAFLDVQDIDVWMRRCCAQTKGTDWVDGFFWGISVSLFAGFILALWAKDFLTKDKKKKDKSD